jgi:hypothetical protein
MGGQGGAANKKGEVTNFGDLLITSLWQLTKAFDKLNSISS